MERMKSSFRTTPAHAQRVEGRITHNRAKCNKCNDVVESMHRHDFRWCKCGAIAVDGGREYLRRVGDFGNVTELSEYEHSDNA